MTAQPLLPHIIRSGFVLLDHSDDYGEFLLGTCARFWALRPDRCPGVEDAGAFLRFKQPGYAKATLYFGTEEVAPNRTRLTTTTRVEPLDPVSRRRFGAYWRLILPGSALLRRSWLEAVKRRSELEAT